MAIRDKDPSIKSLVVSQFTSFLDIVEDSLKEHDFLFVRLDGRMTQEARAHAIETFSDPSSSSPTVFLLSLTAGGVGLNLTAAARVFLLDPVSWKLSAVPLPSDGESHYLFVTFDRRWENFMMALVSSGWPIDWFAFSTFWYEKSTFQFSTWYFSLGLAFTGAIAGRNNNFCCHWKRPCKTDTCLPTVISWFAIWGEDESICTDLIAT